MISMSYEYKLPTQFAWFSTIFEIRCQIQNSSRSWKLKVKSGEDELDEVAAMEGAGFGIDYHAVTVAVNSFFVLLIRCAEWFARIANA